MNTKLLKERIFVTFNSYELGIPLTATYVGKNLKEIALEILRKHNWGEDIKRTGEVDGIDIEGLDKDPIQVLTDILCLNNGDDCDLILSIVDLTRGIVLFPVFKPKLKIV